MKNPVRAMRLLLHIHSILSVHGQLDATQISEKLQIRGVYFDLLMLHKMLHSEAAGYFGIRYSTSNRAFYAIQFTTPEPVKAPVVVKPVEPKAPVRTSDYEAKKAAVIAFCVANGRIPSANKGKEECALYTFMNNNREDREFYKQVEKYKKRAGRRRGFEPDFKLTELGAQLAESGGAGSF